jgi:hypothetical protein
MRRRGQGSSNPYASVFRKSTKRPKDLIVLFFFSGKSKNVRCRFSQNVGEFVDGEQPFYFFFFWMPLAKKLNECCHFAYISVVGSYFSRG